MLIIGGYSVVARCEQIGDPSPIARSNQQHAAVATTSTSTKTNNVSAYQPAAAGLLLNEIDL